MTGQNIRTRKRGRGRQARPEVHRPESRPPATCTPARSRSGRCAAHGLASAGLRCVSIGPVVVGLPPELATRLGHAPGSGAGHRLGDRLERVPTDLALASERAQGIPAPPNVPHALGGGNPRFGVVNEAAPAAGALLLHGADRYRRSGSLRLKQSPPCSRRRRTPFSGRPTRAATGGTARGSATRVLPERAGARSRRPVHASSPVSPSPGVTTTRDRGSALAPLVAWGDESQ